MRNQELKLSDTPFAGVGVRYVKTRQTLYIGGWYDGFVAISEKSVSLGQFLTRLGITEKDVRKALKNSAK